MLFGYTQNSLQHGWRSGVGGGCSGRCLVVGPLEGAGPRCPLFFFFFASFYCSDRDPSQIQRRYNSMNLARPIEVGGMRSVATVTCCSVINSGARCANVRCCK
jgi:hypothetical protein